MHRRTPEQPGYDVDYPHRNVKFGSDCVCSLRRRFLDPMRTVTEFLAGGEDYLKTPAVVDAVYGSARRGEEVRL